MTSIIDRDTEAQLANDEIIELMRQFELEKISIEEYQRRLEEFLVGRRPLVDEYQEGLQERLGKRKSVEIG